MRHIQLYEAFEDHLDPSTRNVFGLTSEIELGTYPPSHWKTDYDPFTCYMTGPTETEEEVRPIAEALKKIAERHWQSYNENRSLFRFSTKWPEFLEHILEEDAKPYQKELDRLGWSIQYREL